MANFNKVLLMGNLTKDPELRYTPSGVAVANLRLAVNHRYKDRAGELKQEVCFINAVVWNKQAETCNQYLQKGRSIFVEGRLQSRSWQDKEGKNRITIEVRADRVLFLDSSGQKQAGVKEDLDIDKAPEKAVQPIGQPVESVEDVPWPQEMDEQIS